MIDDETNPDRGAELLNISIDIGHGQKSELHVHEFDDLPLTIRNFFIRNNITNHSEKALLYKVQELLEEAKEEHQLMAQTLANMPNLTGKKWRNSGERIYKQSMQAQEMKLVKHQMIRIQTAKNLLNSGAGKPIIDKNSIKIVSSLTSKASDSKKFQFQKNILNADLKEKPKLIQKKSKKKVEQRVEELFKDAEVRKKKNESAKRERELNEFSFKPEINRKSTEMKREGDVIERLIKLNEEKEKNLQELRKRLDLDVDLQTGQKWFQPVIGRGPENEDEGRIIKLYKHQKRNSDSSLNYPYSPVKLEGGAQTDKILKKKKEERFLQIFNMLNPDPSYGIHPSNIKLKKLGESLNKVLQPLLYEISEANSFITFQDFCDSMENLLKILTPIEKNLILFGNKKKKEENTEKLAKHKKSCSMGGIGGIFLRDSERQRKVDAKMQMEKEKVIIEEKMGCTFKPKTAKYKPHKK